MLTVYLCKNLTYMSTKCIDNAKMSITRNALAAKNGNLMQKCLEVKKIRSALTEEIVNLAFLIKEKECKKEYIEYPNGKKCDVVVHPYNIKLQVKRLQSFEKDRGYHVDRRDLNEFSKYFSDKTKVEQLMNKLMISKTISENEKRELVEHIEDKTCLYALIFDLIFGMHKPYRPSHMLFVETQGTTFKFYMCESYTLFGYIMKHSTVSVKQTCLHIGKNVYFQRRGGDATDKKPNQVQTKLKLTPDIRKLCKLVYVGSQELSDYSIDDICNNAVAQIE